MKITDKMVRAAIRRCGDHWRLDDRIDIGRGWNAYGHVARRGGDPWPNARKVDLGAVREQLDDPCEHVSIIGHALDGDRPVAIFAFDGDGESFGIDEGYLPLFDGLAILGSRVLRSICLVGVDARGRKQLLVAERLVWQ